MSEFDITSALKKLLNEYSEESASEVIETLLYNPSDLTDEDHTIIDQLQSHFLRTAAQIFVEDLSYDFNTLVNYWEAFIGQLTEEQSAKVLEYALEQTNVDFVEDFIIGYRKFYVNPKESITFFSKLDANEFHEIKFFIGRCYEALNEYDKAIESYNQYLDHPYFKNEENQEQANINRFYINHTIASLYFKMNDMKKVIETVDEIIEPIGFNQYLENFSNPEDEEIKKFLVEYADALDATNETIKANSLREKITNFFN
ncbi:tetratricopeptide repeat protein [Faecalibacter bovis]|uniref:Tetratricopeptide repeat protein n=1 Tax=Faecalibacter bovis TaxID=2898187 RepID=A0ABX7XCN0_9FLAO|nr:hypothetical protein [Faecalibacter bovis]MBS7332267.1 hypothetical protein [Weeksellaceae bacterium]QTV05595.1 hypothetical protein J9309_12615 [Faecalibacter bovis]